MKHLTLDDVLGVDTPPYVTRAVIQQRFGIAANTMWKWAQDDSFPKPWSGVDGANVYDWEAVVRWQLERRLKRGDIKLPEDA